MREMILTWINFHAIFFLYELNLDVMIKGDFLSVAPPSFSKLCLNCVHFNYDFNSLENDVMKAEFDK